MEEDLQNELEDAFETLGKVFEREPQPLDWVEGEIKIVVTSDEGFFASSDPDAISEWISDHVIPDETSVQFHKIIFTTPKPDEYASETLVTNEGGESGFHVTIDKKPPTPTE